MNLAMTMTMDGLIRALRWQAHDLAENLEQEYSRSGRAAATNGHARRAEAPARAGGKDDDRAGR